MDPLHPYPSPEQRESLLSELSAAVGGELVAYGASVEGRPLYAVRVPGAASGLPRVLCNAGIHGPELVAGLCALELLRELAGSDSPAGDLRRRAEVWVAPCLNPDGYARTWERDGRGQLVELRPKARGVDLNRNFPPPAGRRMTDFPGAGSSTPGGPNYRGPAPLSEPESAALDSLLRAQRFHASVSLHSFMGTVIPARVTDRAHYAAYRELAGALRRAQPRHRYRRLASRWIDVFTGELEDHQHHNLSCWSACVEMMTLAFSYRQHLRAPALFWRFNPRDPRPWIENDLPGVIALLRAALELPPPETNRR